MRATGGEVGAASSLAPKIGPLGLSPKKIGAPFLSLKLEATVFTAEWQCHSVAVQSGALRVFWGWKAAGRVRSLTEAAELSQGCRVRALLGSFPGGWSVSGRLCEGSGCN